jgi:hypothetical protein
MSERAGQGVWFHVLPCRGRGRPVTPPARVVVVPHCWTRDTGTTQTSNGRSPMWADRRRSRARDRRRAAGAGRNSAAPPAGPADWRPHRWRARSRSWLRACAVGGSARPATGTAARAPTGRSTPRTLVAPHVVGSDGRVVLRSEPHPWNAFSCYHGARAQASHSVAFFSLTSDKEKLVATSPAQSRTSSSRQTGLAPDTSRPSSRQADRRR